MYRGGGFADSRDDRLPESVAIRAEVADESDQREREREEQVRRVRVRELEESNIRASIVAAQQRGEWVNLRQAWADGGVGRTRSEALEYFVAQQEAEDARAEWQERKEFEQWRRDRQEGSYADVTAPTEAEVAEREQTAARARKRRDEDDLVIVARELARLDRQRDR
jgi:hypothetical protein